MTLSTLCDIQEISALLGIPFTYAMRLYQGLEPREAALESLGGWQCGDLDCVDYVLPIAGASDPISVRLADEVQND